MEIYSEISSFYESFRGEKRIFGKSAEGRNLYAFHIGTHSGAQILSQYAIHGREWVTSLLALEHIGRGVQKGGAWILPLTNPDGAQICCRAETKGAALWKANARGVDLNVNFDARWGTGAQNTTFRGAENCIGDAPFSEPETRALRDFTLEQKPQLTLSWHTKGEEIYWEFHQPPARRLRDGRLAKILARSTGYPLVSVKNSAGGYKDWCIEKLKIPAFTIEVGPNALPHPLTEAALKDILSHGLNALSDLADAL